MPEQPAGRPFQEKTSPPAVPPDSIVLNVTDWPTSAEVRDAVGVVTVGSGFTTTVMLEVAVLPTLSVTVTVAVYPLGPDAVA